MRVATRTIYDELREQGKTATELADESKYSYLFVYGNSNCPIETKKLIYFSLILRPFCLTSDVYSSPALTVQLTSYVAFGIDITFCAYFHFVVQVLVGLSTDEAIYYSYNHNVTTHSILKHSWFDVLCTIRKQFISTTNARHMHPPPHTPTGFRKQLDNLLHVSVTDEQLFLATIDEQYWSKLNGIITKTERLPDQFPKSVSNDCDLM